MECKFEEVTQKCEENEELIETLWNVNFLDDESSKYALIELIETLWNVNVYPLLNVMFA